MMRTSLVIGLTVGGLLLGCKAQNAVTNVKDFDVLNDEGRPEAIGARDGIVKYRMCTDEEWTALRERTASRVYVDECSLKVRVPGVDTEVFYPDIEVEEYERLLCDSFQFDQGELDAAQAKVKTSEKLQKYYSRQLERAQGQLDSANSGMPADGIGDQSGQSSNVEDLTKQIEDLKGQVATHERNLKLATEIVNRHSTAKSNCADLMAFVLPDERGVPRHRPINPETKDGSGNLIYQNLLFPFKSKVDQLVSQKKQQEQEEKERLEQQQQEQAQQEQEQREQDRKNQDELTESITITAEAKFRSSCANGKANNYNVNSQSWRAFYQGKTDKHCKGIHEDFTNNDYEVKASRFVISSNQCEWDLEVVCRK